MKTAISMPDDTFARVSERAQQLGLSRSELLTRAAVAYLGRLDAASLTARINAALELVGADDDLDDVVAAGKRHLLAIDDDW
ncbi:CopG family transcriptional regulator [uncultured Friedmanniella sp.]|uniref:ribbon-helix-helix domain-containing protein n=1 Tax=uncultured Friedmanniella sp. TaxID=335381 RepID=UPI0035CBAA6E